MRPGFFQLAVMFLFVVTVAGCGAGAPAAKPADDRRVSTNDKTQPAEIKSKDIPDTVEIKANHDYQGWKKYAPPEGAFQVHFPKEPVVNAPSPATGNFTVAVVQRRSDDEVGYICQWTIKEKAPQQGYLQGQQMGALKSSKGKLVEERDITLNKVPGREFIIELPDKNVFRWRNYLAGNRVISLQVQGKDLESVRSTDAVKFLDSVNIN